MSTQPLIPPKPQSETPDFIPAPTNSAPDFIPATSAQQPSAVSQPAILSAAKPQPWLMQADEDLRQGGNRTLVGRVLGHLQGNGDKGYSGLESGVSPEVADFMGSAPLGAVKAAQGVSEIPQHPVRGLLKTGAGVLQAATIPLSVAGGPEIDAAADAIPELIPTRRSAGRLFSDVMDAAKDQPVRLSLGTIRPLERTQQLAMAGGKPFSAADKLYQRIQTVNPLTYGEARDFASNMSLSPEEKMGLKKSMQYEVPKLARSFNQDIGRAAEAAGKGQEYQEAMSQYRRAARNKELADWGTKKLLPKVAVGLGGAAAYEAGKRFLK